MNTKHFPRSLACWLLTASIAGAQHVDILLWDDDGQIGVGQYDYDNLIASETRVHLARFDAFYSVNNPGFTAFPGPDALPGNANLEWDFLPMTVDSGPHTGYESTLLYWDGIGVTPEFGPTPTGGYEFSLFGLNNPAKADGGDQLVRGDVIDITPPNGAIHEHRYYFLDDNGDELNTTLPEAGIYVVGMRMRIAGLENSKPLFMVWATPELKVLPAIRPAALWVNERVDSLVVEGLPGDYNADGIVNIADYTVWRDSLGQVGATLAADGNGNETVDAADYAVWRDNFRATAIPSAPPSAIAVPESTSSLLLAFSLIGLGRIPRVCVSLGA